MDQLRVRGGHVDLDDLVVVDAEGEVAVRVKQTILGHYVVRMLSITDFLLLLRRRAPFPQNARR